MTLFFWVDAEEEDKYLPVSDDPMSLLILEAIKNDDLRKVLYKVEILIRSAVMALEMLSCVRVGRGSGNLLQQSCFHSILKLLIFS